MRMEELFQKERMNFPVLKDKIYLASASTGLIPNYVYNGVRKYEDQRYLIGGNSTWDGLSTTEMIQESKKRLGKMLNCGSEDIAFGLNSSHMFTLITEGLPLRKGENVVLSEDVFIGNRFAWQLVEKRGVTLRFVKSNKGIVTPDDIQIACDKNTRVISLCYVESSTGFRYDMEAIGALCAENGIILAVDGVQAIGVLDVDIKKTGIDFLVGNSYKWMLNYCGTGFAFISKKLIGILKQPGAGWMSDDERFNTRKKQLKLRADAGRYELGYPNVAGIYALSLVSQRYLELSGEVIEKYVMELIEYIYDEVDKISGICVQNPYPQENRSSIVYIAVSEEISINKEMLLKEGIIVDGQADEKGRYIFRVSIHYFNNKNDIDMMLNAIKALLPL